MHSVRAYCMYCVRRVLHVLRATCVACIACDVRVHCVQQCTANLDAQPRFTKAHRGLSAHRAPPAPDLTRQAGGIRGSASLRPRVSLAPPAPPQPPGLQRDESPMIRRPGGALMPCLYVRDLVSVSPAFAAQLDLPTQVADRRYLPSNRRPPAPGPRAASGLPGRQAGSQLSAERNPFGSGSKTTCSPLLKEGENGRLPGFGMIRSAIACRPVAGPEPTLFCRARLRPNNSARHVRPFRPPLEPEGAKTLARRLSDLRRLDRPTRIVPRRAPMPR